MRNIVCEEKTVLLLTDRLNRKYLSGVDIAEGVLICGATTAYFTDSRYFYAAKEKLSKVGILAKLYSGLESVMDFIKEVGITKVLVDYSTVTVKEYNEYSSFGVEIGDCSDALKKMRSIKDESELNLIKKACDIAEKAYWKSIYTIFEGMTETELKNTIEENVVKFGGDGSSFDIIVAFGSNSAVPHHETGETKLKKDNVILVDMGAIVGGYMSDLTRTVFFGNPNEKFTKCYNAVLEANLTAEEKISSGTKTDEADKIARDVLKKYGLDEYFTHSLGHGVGLEIHEYPTLSRRMSESLLENQVFTVEPGVYFDGEFGIRIEDTVVIKDGKLIRLFGDDKSLVIIK